MKKTLKNMNNKLKVVWICHFSNEEINDILKPYKRMPEKAPWISNSIKMLENVPQIELFIISPYEYISGIKKFKLCNINYIFFNAHMPIIGRHWPGFFKWDYLSNFFTSKLIVKRIVKRIHPDLIHLQTAENAYISSTILPLIDKYPTILTVQGFISQAEYQNNIVHKKRISVEKEIIEKMNFAFYRTEQMVKDIRSFNNHINLFWNRYPDKFNFNSYNFGDKKEYDIVFFARVTKEKGIYDLIDAISLLQNKYSLLIIGSGNKEEVLRYAKEKKILNQITWGGFYPTQDDVFKEASKAKISVLPTHFDLIPGTVIESMFLSLPVVTNAVGGLPEINKTGEFIKMVENGDINALSKAIDILLLDDDLMKKMSLAGYNRAKEMFSYPLDKLTDSLLVGYKSAIQGFRSNHK